MHFDAGALDIGGMPGCHRKLWENVMEAIVKLEKTNTMTNTWRQTKTKTKTRIAENKRGRSICLKYQHPEIEN